MHPMEQDIPYNIHIAPVEQALGAFLKINSFSSVAVLVDENTKKHCYPKIESILPAHTLIEIASGELNKNLDTCTDIWNKLTKNKFNRKSILINLGGGVIGDMGGFCASTFKRGITFVQVPTTLLSQVDASVGGKLGIDFQGLKNHIGVFNNPQAVFIDVAFLQTLPKREFSSGFAEVIKHALIRDKIHFEYLIEQIDQINVEAVVDRSVDIKKAVVLEDFEELGPRKILNFGHTIGHAIESYLLESPNAILHGEAVAAGMVCEAYISSEKGLLNTSELDIITEFIDQQYPKPSIQEKDIDALIEQMAQDKKNTTSDINFTLLKGIGNAVYDQTASSETIRKALQFYIAL